MQFNSYLPIAAMNNFRFSIDRGGTFTDVYAECPNGEVEVLKLLSEDPAYKDAPTEAIRRILQQVLKSFHFLYNSSIFLHVCKEKATRHFKGMHFLMHVYLRRNYNT